MKTVSTDFFLSFLTFLAFVAVSSASADADAVSGTVSSFNATLEAPHRVQLITSGALALRAHLDAIVDAKQSIELESFAFDPKDTGRLILDALIEKAKDGVKVRILIDSASGPWTDDILAEIYGTGIQIKFFRPNNPNSIPRFHRKFLVIDGKFAIAGGRNLNQHNFQVAEPKYRLDYTIRLEGPILKNVQETFNEFWSSPYFEIIATPASTVPTNTRLTRVEQTILEGVRNINVPAPKFFDVHKISFVSDSPNAKERVFTDELRKRMLQIDHSIVTETPYYLFSKSLRDTFRTLTRNRKSVVMIDGHTATDYKIFFATLYLGGRQSAQDIPGATHLVLTENPLSEVSPLLFPEAIDHKTTMSSHAKSTVFDDRDVLLGSFNYDIFSELNIEAGFYFENTPEFAGYLRQIQMSRSYIPSK